MKQVQKLSKILLYAGLSILFVAFALKWAGMPACFFWFLLGVAIAFKTFFLIFIFQAKGFRPALWLYFILTGVVLILISLLFKTVFSVPALYRILFYGAISLKVAGLILMLFSKARK